MTQDATFKLFDGLEEGCRSPYELGNLHGGEDIDRPLEYRALCPLTSQEQLEYEAGYVEGWGLYK